MIGVLTLSVARLVLSDSFRISWTRVFFSRAITMNTVRCAKMHVQSCAISGQRDNLRVRGTRVSDHSEDKVEKAMMLEHSTILLIGETTTLSDYFYSTA